jgi:hypothetical protein
VACVGRRKLYLYGLSIIFVLLLAIGGGGVAHRSDASSWAAGSLILVYTFFYNFTIGSVGYSIVSEIPSTRLKNNTVALARCAYNIERTQSQSSWCLLNYADHFDTVQHDRQHLDAPHALAPKNGTGIPRRACSGLAPAPSSLPGRTSAFQNLRAVPTASSTRSSNAISAQGSSHLPLWTTFQKISQSLSQ